MKKKRIESITLKDIGVFKDATIDFPAVPVTGKAEVHIFTGKNGSGKTTLLEALIVPFGGDTALLERKMNGEKAITGVFDNKKYRLSPFHYARKDEQPD